MSKCKQFNRVAISLRQPSFLEGVARFFDITNALGDEHLYFAQMRGTYVVKLEIEQNLVTSSMDSICQDWDKVSCDLRTTRNKMEQKFHKELEVV